MKLTYTEDFKIACKINNLKHEELLQYYIDHVSFYAFIGGETDLVYHWANQVNIECEKIFDGVTDEHVNDSIQKIILKYVKQLAGLSINDKLSKEDKIESSVVIMKAWSIEMIPLINYERQFNIGDGHLLDLTFDFNLLCRVNGISLTQSLQWFIDNISLARERSINLLDTVKTNPSMAVLLLVIISNNEIKDRIMPHQEIYKKYGLQLLKLDKKQRQEPNIRERTNVYSAFYLDWYNTLNSMN